MLTVYPLTRVSRVLQNENSRVSSTPYSTAGTRTAIVGDMTPSNVAYGTKYAFV